MLAVAACSGDPAAGSLPRVADAAPSSDAPPPPRDAASDGDAGAGGDATPPNDADLDAPLDASDTTLGDAGDAAIGRARVVLFGGTGGGSSLGDTWIFDGKAWSQFTGAGPGLRSENPAMATLDGKAVLFGGTIELDDGGPGNLPDGGHYHVEEGDDTWVFDGQEWTHVAATPSPPARDSAVMANLDGELVLFGGQNLDARPPTFTDTWTFGVGGYATGWVQVPTSKSPLTPVWAAMAPLGHALIVFGGETQIQSAETWSFDGKDWTLLDVPGPSARFGSAMAPLGNKVVLFGGFDALHPANLDETWTFDGTTWTKLDVHGPSGRSSPTMAPLGDKLVLFGGFDGKDEDDTWTFDGATWTKLDIPGPPGRWLAAMTSM